MVDTKKQERDELHRAIWAIADELRGAVDGWDFKNYVLGTMFYRYISENLCNYINTGEADAGNTDFDYAMMSDEEAEVVLCQEKVQIKCNHFSLCLAKLNLLFLSHYLLDFSDILPHIGLGINTRNGCEYVLYCKMFLCIQKSTYMHVYN